MGFGHPLFNGRRIHCHPLFDGRRVHCHPLLGDNSSLASRPTMCVSSIRPLARAPSGSRLIECDGILQVPRKTSRGMANTRGSTKVPRSREVKVVMPVSPHVIENVSCGIPETLPPDDPTRSYTSATDSRALTPKPSKAKFHRLVSPGYIRRPRSKQRLPPTSGQAQSSNESPVAMVVFQGRGRRVRRARPSHSSSS